MGTTGGSFAADRNTTLSFQVFDIAVTQNSAGLQNQIVAENPNLMSGFKNSN